MSVITTDNASNMGRAIDISDIKLKISSFARTLDLAAKKAVYIAKPISKRMKPVITFLHRKVQVGKDQENAQSEKDSHSENQGGEKTKPTIRYLYHENIS